MQEKLHDLIERPVPFDEVESVKETYRVASNPDLNEPNQKWLHVLFSGESHTKPNHRLGPKVYDFYLMHLVLSGKGSFTTENRQYELSAGDTFLIRPNQLISYESDAHNPWYYRWVAFRGEQVEYLLQVAGFSSDQDIVSIPTFEQLDEYYRQILDAFRYSHPTSSIHASGILHLIMTQYGRALQALEKTTHRQQVHEYQLHKQIIHYFTTQYTHPVSIEQMAETLGYNRAYLSRIFKQKLGVTPSTFLLHLRLDKAKHLLRERPDLTIEQVSASVGIQDALYFSKQFKKLYQQSPTSYRKDVLDSLE